MQPYFNIHNHTEISNALLGFPDVICRIPDLVTRAYECGLSGIAVTEHEGISSHLQVLKAYKKLKDKVTEKGEEFRPFKVALGNEIYLQEEWEDENNRNLENDMVYPYYHFILMALDTEGHHQLRQISTMAWKRSYVRNFRRRPTLYSDLEKIIKPNQGHIVCSTACLGSRIDNILLNNCPELKDLTDKQRFIRACKEVDRLVDIFGIGNVYLEVQPPATSNNDQSRLNLAMIQLSQYTGIPIIPSTDTHYLNKEDRFIHEVYLRSQDGEREVGDFYGTTYMMDSDELTSYFVQGGVEESTVQTWIDNSNKLMERVGEYNITHNPIIPEIPVKHIPQFEISHRFKQYYTKYPAFGYYATETQSLHEQYFFYQIEQGLESKIVNNPKKVDLLEKYIARLNEEWTELKIISETLDTKMVCYYSSMSKIIELIWAADSLVGPARGSAAGFLTCYLLEVTQIDPVPLGDYFPSWRHINHQRGVELPDIDVDSEASKKTLIVNKMKEYFGENKVLNVATFNKLSSKTAIERAVKGLGQSSAIAGYLKSLIPVSRGKVASLKETVYGNPETGQKPVSEFVAECKKYDHLLECALALEGLITNRGLHAAGVIVCNNDYTDYISAMCSNNGTMCTCYDLWDSEEAGCIKFDMLTVEAIDKIHKTMDLLIQYDKLPWEGSLKETYYKHIHPDVLEYDDPKMWDILPTVYSVFQFDTPISSKALEATKPHSAMDLSAANSLLRLMPDNANETPIDRYIRYKKSYEAWVEDTKNYGLDDNERAILWNYLADAYGMADSQEKVMRLSMDEHTSHYSLKEANALRKSIAKKDKKLQEKAKKQFFEYCEKAGTREVFADYIWNIVFAASMGYSFSQLHSYSYSIIALQELNLNWFYPIVYWNCACLSVESNGGEEDKAGSIDYSEMCKAIYKMRLSNIFVSPPSINSSNVEFTPVEDNNRILFGLCGISGINADIAQQIIDNRPYASFRDFFNKNYYKGSLVTSSKFVQLIKAGCFDEFNPDRIHIMKLFVAWEYGKKDKLTMANLDNAVSLQLPIPKQLLSPYKFKQYVCSKQFYVGNHPKFKSKKLYWLDNKALKYFNNHCKSDLKEDVDWWVDGDVTIVVDKALEKYFAPILDELKTLLNEPQFIEAYNKKCMAQKFNQYVPVVEVNKWSFEACSYYATEHELAHVDFEGYNIDKFSDLPKDPVFVDKVSRGRTWKQYALNQICGVVIGRTDSHHIVHILTPELEVVNVKFYAGAFAHYKSMNTTYINIGTKVVKSTIEKPWLIRGNLLLFSGYRRDENEFVCKRYTNSIYRHSVQKITAVNPDGSIEIQSTRIGYEDDSED